MVNKLELCKKFNILRIDNQHKEYSSSEMIKLLKEIGINSHIFQEMNRNRMFERRKEGKAIFYKFPNTPIHIETFKKFYKDYNTTVTNPKNKEEKAISLLKSLGYRIYKPVNFNEEAFSKAYPDIYNEFLEVKEIL